MVQRTSVRFRGDPELIEEIARLLEASDGAEVLAVQTEQDADAGLDFDIVVVATLVGLVSQLFFDGPIIPTLLEKLRRRPGERITIETPTRTVTIESSAQLSEDEVRKLMASLAS